MPKSRISRIIALLALLTVALVLAMASGGEPFRDGIRNGGWSGDEPVIEFGFHFGW
jgi:hypothetical protein